MKKILYLSLLSVAAIFGAFSESEYSQLGAVIAAGLIMHHFTPRAGDVLGFEIGTVASGVGTATNFQLQFLPQFLYWIQTAAVDVRVNVLGPGIIWDVPAAGIAELGVFRQIGRFTNVFVIPLANGLIKNQTVTITITNQVASAFTLYGWSENEGDEYVQGLQQVIQAPGGTDITDFYALSAPAAGATDQYNLTMQNGLQQLYRREELRARLQRTQNVINTAGYNVDNLDREVKRVNIVPAAQQTVYIMRALQIGSPNNALISRAN